MENVYNNKNIKLILYLKSKYINSNKYITVIIIIVIMSEIEFNNNKDKNIDRILKKKLYIPLSDMQNEPLLFYSYLLHNLSQIRKE